MAAAGQQVAAKRLAARMGADLARLPDSTPWARGTWHGTRVLVTAQRVAGDHVGHGDTAAHADMLDALTEWVYEMAAAGAQEIWIHQPRITPLHPDHRLRASVHADPELATRLALLSDTPAERPRQGAWAGSALTPTGHDVVIVRA